MEYPIFFILIVSKIPKYFICEYTTYSYIFNGYLVELDFMHLIKCKSHLERISSIKAFIYFRNLEERNFLTRCAVGSESPSTLGSVNISLRIFNLDDLMVILIYSLNKSLFFSLKPNTLYSTS